MIKKNFSKKCKANAHKNLHQLSCFEVQEYRTECLPNIQDTYLMEVRNHETFRKRTRSATIAFLSDVLVSTARSIARLMSNSPVSDPPQAQMEYKACIMSWSSPVIIKSVMME